MRPDLRTGIRAEGPGRHPKQEDIARRERPGLDRLEQVGRVGTREEVDRFELAIRREVRLA